MQTFEMCAPCLFGLESIVVSELRALGADEIKAEDGRVSVRLPALSWNVIRLTKA